MKRKIKQTEKLFSHEELNQLVKKMDSLELMEKIESKHGLRNIFNNTKYNNVITNIKKLTRL